MLEVKPSQCRANLGSLSCARLRTSCVSRRDRPDFGEQVTRRVVRPGAIGPGDTVIRETPGVCGGYPCIGNTRIPVRLVVLAERSLGTVDRIVEAYPQLAPEQVRAALDYYKAHPERVDEDIETNAQVLEELTRRPWPA
jgi:uncharacterized protein (DUF433 family)